MPARVVVDEKGTIAAGVTVVEVMEPCVARDPLPRLELCLSREFVFGIVDIASNTVMFRVLGQINSV